jgi:hypothetical protein
MRLARMRSQVGEDAGSRAVRQQRCVQPSSSAVPLRLATSTAPAEDSGGRQPIEHVPSPWGSECQRGTSSGRGMQALAQSTQSYNGRYVFVTLRDNVQAAGDCSNALL